MEHHLVLRVIAKQLLPFMLLFGLYVLFHGDTGPGGGFQAGVIFAAGFILYGLIFGVDNLSRVVPFRLARSLAACGVLIYSGVGIAGLFFGGNFLDYSVLDSEPVEAQHLGIMLVEIGVGITVAAVMTMVFILFARQR